MRFPVSAAVLVLGLSPATAETRVGVPACDAFVSQIRTCIAERDDESDRRIALEVIGRLNERWTGLASISTMRPRLEADCRRLVGDLARSSGPPLCSGPAARGEPPD